MKKIGELVTNEQAFEGIESVKVKDVLGKKIELLEICSRTSKDGDFFILKVKTEQGKEVSFCNGSKVVMEKIKKAITTFEQEIKEEPIKLKESIEMTIVEKRSSEGKVYMDIE